MYGIIPNLQKMHAYFISLLQE